MVRNQWVQVALVSSQDLFLAVLNGGLIPIRPETGERLTSIPTPGNWRMGERLGRSKVIRLLFSATKRLFFADLIKFQNITMMDPVPGSFQSRDRFYRSQCFLAALFVRRPKVRNNQVQLIKENIK